MHEVVISYRREEAAGHAGHLHVDLNRELGDDRVFLDIKGIRGGERFEAYIKQTLSRATVLLVLIGSGWIDTIGKDGKRRLDESSDPVRTEIRTALELDSKIEIIPVLVGGAKMPDKEMLPKDIAELTEYNAVEISDLRWEFDITQLAATLRGIFLLKSVAPEPEGRSIDVKIVKALKQKLETYESASVEAERAVTNTKRLQARLKYVTITAIVTGISVLIFSIFLYDANDKINHLTKLKTEHDELLREFELIKKQRNEAIQQVKSIGKELELTRSKQKGKVKPTDLIQSEDASLEGSLSADNPFDELQLILINVHRDNKAVDFKFKVNGDPNVYYENNLKKGGVQARALEYKGYFYVIQCEEAKSVGKESATFHVTKIKKIDKNTK